MNIFYAISNGFSFALFAAIVAAVCCWPKRRGQALLITAFVIKAIAALCFLSINIAYQRLAAFTFQNRPTTDYWEILQYFSVSVQVLEGLATVLLLLGILMMLMEFNQMKAATDGNGTELPTPKTPADNSVLLFALGVFGLVIWPVAVFVRYYAAKDLASMRLNKMDNAGQEQTKIAYVLGSIGSLLLIGVGLTLLIMYLAFSFQLI